MYKYLISFAVIGDDTFSIGCCDYNIDKKIEENDIDKIKNDIKTNAKKFNINVENPNNIKDLLVLSFSLYNS